MFRGLTTLKEYEECFKRGLCEEHKEEINKSMLESVNRDNNFPLKAFKFVRVNVLLPLLFKTPPLCEKIKKIMVKTPLIAKILNAGEITQDAVNVILIMDSVVIFTLCQLSKICCIGALYFPRKKTNIEDPNINAMQNLLLVDRFENANLCYLFPVLKKNFVGCDLDIVKATHFITILFIRKYCKKQHIALHIDSEYDKMNVNMVLEVNVNSHNEIKKTKNTSFPHDLFYHCKEYADLGESCLHSSQYKLCALYYHLSVTMDPLHSSVFNVFVNILRKEDMYFDALRVIQFAKIHGVDGVDHLENLVKAQRNMQSDYLGPGKNELLKSAADNPVNCAVSNNKAQPFIKGKRLFTKKEKRKPIVVDLVDSDSTESDCEIIKEAKDTPEPIGVSGSRSETPVMPPLVSDGESECLCKTSGAPELVDDVDSDSPSKTPDVAETPDSVDSDSLSRNSESKSSVSEGKERSKYKSGAARKKRTVSEGSVDTLPEEEMDIGKINSYLKEASGALLADCGYKAVQIFRGPLRHFIESSKFPSFEECDIVCIKYSYGIAYCKSGGYDDLQKCITILKDIIESHDSIKFPAAHYSLGLAYRKLNRFKEALNYLEIVESFLSKGIHFKVYPWPGMPTVIQETKADTLKALVQDLIKECENPPNADAFCRCKNCGFQRTIYYTDPDFKGYTSLHCSEQCNLQYHLQCWKTMKEERNLTDKEFLEKPCSTPDCGGVVVKIQNIDKKGDLSKEFTSEFKKPPKQKWAKWEKKPETKEKEKKKKKPCVKSEEGSQEVLNDGQKNTSRQNSNAEDESASHLLSSELPTKGMALKSGSTKPSYQSNIQKVEVHSNSSNNSDSRSTDSYEQEIANDVALAAVRENTPENESGLQLAESIKNSVYSFMADFLSIHGPLNIDDSLTINEMASFPDEVHKIISDYGGIGEFLKDDLRFAFVGNLYICVIDDLATAYQMLSSTRLPADLEDFPPLGSTLDSTYSTKSGRAESKRSSFGLNPDAVDFTPNSKCNGFKFITDNAQPLSYPSNSSPTISFESSAKYPNGSNAQLDTFPEAEIRVNKSRSCDMVLNSPSKSKSYLSYLGQSNKSSEKTSSNPPHIKMPASSEKLRDKYKRIGVQLSFLLKDYFSDDMKYFRESDNSSLKSYLIKKVSDLDLEEKADSSALLKDTIIEGLKMEIYELSKKNSSLQTALENSTKMQRTSSDELTSLKKDFSHHNMKIETLKKNHNKREEDWLMEKNGLLQRLKGWEESVCKMKAINTSLTEEKHGLERNTENLNALLNKSDEKMKNALDAQDKKMTAIILILQKENADFKIRAKYAELQVLTMKKAGYVKRIEDKSLEAVGMHKDINASMQMMVNHMNPTFLTCIKTFSSKLISYINELSTIKTDFIMKIDEQIKEIEKGVSLRDLEDVEMQDLPPVPTWKSSLPSGLPSSDTSQFSALASYFGLNTSVSKPSLPMVPSNTSIISPSASATKIAAAASASVIPPVPPLTPVIPPTVPPQVTNTPLLPTPAPKTPLLPTPLLDASVKRKDLTAELDFSTLTPSIQESFKSAMASINSYASTPYSAPCLDDDFDKKCVVFKHPDIVPNKKTDLPKLPPGLVNSVPPSTTNRAPGTSAVSEPAAEALGAPGNKSYESLDAVPKMKPNTSQSSLETEKKKISVTGKNSYEKLLGKLKEQFPTHSQEDLVAHLIEFRSQRQGKLSGLPIDTIIVGIRDVIAKKKKKNFKVPEAKVQTKSAKVLINKKLASDTPPPSATDQQAPKKKPAWNIDKDCQRQFSGRADDDCTICCDPMTSTSAYQVACGHAFHENCIRQWLKKNSNCPMCRVLLLLPEEYPPLLM